MNIALTTAEGGAESQSSSGTPLQVVSGVLMRQVRAFDCLLPDLVLRLPLQLAAQIVEPSVCNLHYLKALKAQNSSRTIFGSLCYVVHGWPQRAAGRTCSHPFLSLEALCSCASNAALRRQSPKTADSNKIFRGEARAEAMREVPFAAFEL